MPVLSIPSRLELHVSELAPVDGPVLSTVARKASLRRSGSQCS